MRGLRRITVTLAALAAASSMGCGGGGGTDPNGPAPLTGFVASAAGTDVTVSWDDPTGPGVREVVIVRLYDEPQAPPTDVRYAEGDEGLGGVVAYVGNANSFVDEDLVPGQASYAGYVLDKAGVYSRVALTGTGIALGAQTFTIAGVTDTAAVSVAAQAANLLVEVAPHPDFDPGQEAVFAIDITNLTSQILYAPKIVVRSAMAGASPMDPSLFTNAGVGGGLPDGQLGTDYFFYLEPRDRGMAPGEVREILLSTNQIFAGQTVTLELELVNDPLLVTMTSWDDDWTTGGPLFDTATGTQLGQLEITVTGPGQDYGYRGGVMSKDGRFVYFGSRNSASLTVYDLVSQSQMQVLHLASEHAKASLHHLVEGPGGGILYAVLLDGAHAIRDTDPEAAEVPVYVELVAIDRVKWEEVGRVRLATQSGPTDYGLRGRRMTLSPDGTHAAIPVAAYKGDIAEAATTNEGMGSLHIVDLEALVEVDTDPATAGTQPVMFRDIPVDGGGTTTIDPCVAYWATADTILVGSVWDEAEVGINDTITLGEYMIAEVDVANDYAATAVDIAFHPTRMEVDGTGQVLMSGWVNGITSDLYHYDVAGNAITPVGRGLEVSDFVIASSTLVYATDYDNFGPVDITDGMSAYWAPSSNSIQGNWMGLTPY